MKSPCLSNGAYFDLTMFRTLEPLSQQNDIYIFWILHDSPDPKTAAKFLTNDSFHVCTFKSSLLHLQFSLAVLLVTASCLGSPPSRLGQCRTSAGSPGGLSKNQMVEMVSRSNRTPTSDIFGLWASTLPLQPWPSSASVLSPRHAACL